MASYFSYLFFVVDERNEEKENQNQWRQMNFINNHVCEPLGRMQQQVDNNPKIRMALLIVITLLFTATVVFLLKQTNLPIGIQWAVVAPCIVADFIIVSLQGRNIRDLAINHFGGA